MSKNNHVSALDKDLQSMDTSDMFTKAMAAGFYWQKKYLELRDKVKTMPRFTFLSPKEGGVRRYLDKSGNWIERHDLVEHIENTIEFAPEANLQETIRTQQAEIERLTEQLKAMVETYQYEASSENPTLLASKALIAEIEAENE